MLTGLIHVARPADPDAIDALADTLAALVPGVAAGLVGDAVIVAGRFSEALETIAEGSGATFVVPAATQNQWSAGAAAARREWVLCLEAGDILRAGWIRSLDRFLGTARPDIALGRLHRAHAGLPARLTARAESLVGVSAARAGDVVRRERLAAGSRFAPRLRPWRLAARLDRA